MAFASDKGRQGAAGLATPASGYDIPNSCRFEDGSGAYLSRTPSSASSDADRKKWTWSGWVKLGNLGSNKILWSANTTANYLRIFSDNKIGFGISGVANYQSTAVFRDPSAWYHVVCKVDTTLSSNRIVIYVNNEAVLSVNGYSQDAITPFSNTVVHRIGRDTETPEANYLDGYLAEVNFIDGYAKTPSDFGEFDETYGHWKAKEYTHSDSYGTNGFYLDFKTSGTLGNDESGNDNDWTSNNLAATDQMLDSPTNNFATLNSVDKPSQHTLSEGNLKIQGNTTGRYTTYANFLLPESGKWYWEVKVSGNTTGYWGHGVFEEDATRSAVNGDSNAASIQYYLNQIIIEGVAATFNWSGTVLGIKWDADNKAIQFTDGTSSSSSYTLSGDRYKIGCSGNATSQALQAQIYNFGQDSTFVGTKTDSAGPYADDNNTGLGSFYYTPPTGFLALCTKNLTKITTPYQAHSSCTTEDEYKQVTYTGNGSSDGAFIYLGFLPTTICIDGTSYTNASTSAFDFLSNGIKCRSTTKNANGTSYTLEAWVDVDFKFGTAEQN